MTRARIAFTLLSWSLVLTALPVSARPMHAVLEQLGADELASGPRLRDLVEREALSDDLLIDTQEVLATSAWLEARDLAALDVSLDGPLVGRARRGRSLLLTWTRAGLGSARWVSARHELDALVSGEGWTADSREQMEILLDNARKLDSRVHGRDPYADWAIRMIRTTTPTGTR
jgi:hypothetical protein